MFTIAICDDEELVCGTIERTLRAWAEETENAIAVRVHGSGEELIRSLRLGNRCDLLFLDIELGQLSGVEAAKVIRQELANDWMQIVYISAKTQYTLEQLHTNALDFLVKPVTPESVVEKVTQAMRIWARLEEQFFSFQVGNETYKVVRKDILYIESQGRKLNVYTKEKKWGYNGKLSDAEQEVSSGQFIRIHQSYLINVTHIQRYDSGRILMSDGACFPISKRYKEVVKKSLLSMRMVLRKGSDLDE